MDINYRVENTSDNESVPEFEVYFKILTNKSTFYGQIRGDTLHAGQQAIGSFTKYIHKATADKIIITDVYAPTGS